MINQVTVFLENTEGRLANLCRAMAGAGINMKALSLVDTAEYGLARIICDKPDYAVAFLAEEGFRALKTPVTAIAINDVAGGLAKLMDIFDEADVNVQYGYCFSRNETAIAVFKISAADGVAIAERITNAGFSILKAEDL